MVARVLAVLVMSLGIAACGGGPPEELDGVDYPEGMPEEQLAAAVPVVELFANPERCTEMVVSDLESECEDWIRDYGDSSTRVESIVAVNEEDGVLVRFTGLNDPIAWGVQREGDAWVVVRSGLNPDGLDD